MYPLWYIKFAFSCVSQNDLFTCIISALFLSEFKLAPNIVMTSLFNLNITMLLWMLSGAAPSVAIYAVVILDTRGAQ